MSSDHPSTARPPAWSYAWWLVTGGLFGIGVVSLLTIGKFVLVVAWLMALAATRWPALRNRSAFAGIAGLGVAPLLLAWLNRSGPGRVCRDIAAGTSCTDQYSPWPFLFAGLVLLLGGALLVRRTGPAPSQEMT